MRPPAASYVPHGEQSKWGALQVCNVVIVKEEPNAVDVEILVESVDACRVEARHATNNSVNLSFFQEQLSEIGAVRPGR